MKIYCDFDDTLTKSCERFLDIINSEYGLSASIEDIKDWNFKSIYEKMSDEIINKVFSEQYFFDDLKFFDKSLLTLEGNDVTICTKGINKNIELKNEFLKANNLDFKLIGLGFNDGHSKSSINMKNSIQIDDRYDCLKDTNAKIKILFKNFNQYSWQNVPPMENIYIVNTWEEINQIIQFFKEDTKNGTKHSFSW